jgi:hypothetical protein
MLRKAMSNLHEQRSGIDWMHIEIARRFVAGAKLYVQYTALFPAVLLTRWRRSHIVVYENQPCKDDYAPVLVNMRSKRTMVSLLAWPAGTAALHCDSRCLTVVSTSTE